MVQRHSGADESQATYEVCLLGSVPDSMRHPHSPLTVRTSPGQTLLFRCVGDDAELDDLLERLNSMGLVLTEIHAVASGGNAGDAGDGPSPGETARTYEVRVLGELGSRVLRHLGWSHCALPEQQVACGDATARELDDFLVECARLGLVVESVHRRALPG